MRCRMIRSIRTVAARQNAFLKSYGVVHTSALIHLEWNWRRNWFWGPFGRSSSKTASHGENPFWNRMESYRPQHWSIWSKIAAEADFEVRLAVACQKPSLFGEKRKFLSKKFADFFFRGRKMKRRKSSETRFGKVSCQSEPYSRRKRSFKVSRTAVFGVKKTISPLTFYDFSLGCRR